MTLWSLVPQTGQLASEIISTGTLVREYVCMTFSKNAEDYLYAGTSSGDVCGFHVKTKMLVFTLNLTALGVRTICTINPQQLIVGGGDGFIVKLDLNGKDTKIA